MKHNQTNILLIVLFALGLGACNKSLDTVSEDELEKNEKAIQGYLAKNNLSATKDSTGLYFVKRTTNPQGIKARVGDEVAVYYTMYTLDGEVVDSTETTAKKPLRFPFGVSYHLPGVERGISLMREDEKMTLLLPFKLAFGEVDYERLPAYSPIRLELELVQVRNESQQIADYIRSNNYSVSETTPNGVRIIRQNTVMGDTVGKGKSVNVDYLLRTINGKELQKGTLPPFTTGTGAVVQGFDEGVRHMRRGEKAILIFPSTLGYGRTGKGDVLPYAPLVFEVEVAK